jgi:alkylation response protein AidB-like acyl-CoA dehydrogenase
MPAERLLPTPESRQLLDLAREIADGELAPIAAQHDAEERFPREAFRTLGRAGLLALPYPERYGGGEQPYEVYLQVLEELSARWASVAVGVSVHALACYPLAAFGSEPQRERVLPPVARW